MTNPNLLASIVVSACLGALVGLIRQWSAQTENENAGDLAGMRTHTFWAMLGCIGAFLSPGEIPAMLIVIMLLVGGHQLIMTHRSPMGLPGGTTFAAALLTVLIGALVFWGLRQTAIVVAATTVVMLGMKQKLHAWTRTFQIEDIRATLQFVAITGVILPLVPNRNFGPFDAFNPFSTWMLVVLISGLGFLGYIAMRWLGPRAGIILTSIFGGIASSTATTLAFSRRSKESPGMSAHYAMAVVTACSMMPMRVLVTVGVLSPALSAQLITPFACMLVPAVIFGLWLWFTRHPGSTPVETPKLTNPLSLMTAVRFATAYALIGFLVKAATQLDLLQSGLLPLSFISGFSDMDAISLSMAGNVNTETIPTDLAARAVILAAISNSLLKAGLAISLGSPKLRRDVAIVLGLTALCGVGGFWLI